MNRIMAVVLGVLLAGACGGSDDGGSGSGAGGSGGAGGTAGSGGGDAGSGGGEAGSGGAGGTGGIGGTAGTGGMGGTTGTGGTGGVQPSKAVKGTLVDSTGAPVVGALVALDNDFENFLVTGADGTFRFADVAESYVLTAFYEGQTVHTEGLRRRDPVLNLGSPSLLPREMRLSGTVTAPEPGPFPLAPKQDVLIGTSGIVPLGSVRAQPDGTFSGTVGWFGAKEKTIDIISLLVQWQPNGSFAVLDSGKFASFSLEDKKTVTDLELSLGMGALPSASTTLEIDMGAYRADRYLRLDSVRISGATVRLGWGVDAVDGDSFGFSGDPRFLLSGRDTNGVTMSLGRRAVAGGTTELRLPATSVFKVVTPGDGAVEVSRTPKLGWTPVAGAASYSITLYSGRFALQLRLPGSVSTWSLPDFGTLGGKLGAGEVVWWEILAYVGSQLTVDDFLDGSGRGPHAVHTTDAEVVFDAMTSFKTAP